MLPSVQAKGLLYKAGSESPFKGMPFNFFTLNFCSF
jgi:hypothetical protein